jgi:hypothetical protein
VRDEALVLLESSNEKHAAYQNWYVGQVRSAQTDRVPETERVAGRTKRTCAEL